MQKIKILLAEDDENLGMLLKEYLLNAWFPDKLLSVSLPDNTRCQIS